MSEREQLNATSGPMSKGENAKTDRVLRDDELDAVSGGKVSVQDIHFLRSAGQRPYDPSAGSVGFKRKSKKNGYSRGGWVRRDVVRSFVPIRLEMSDAMVCWYKGDAMRTLRCTCNNWDRAEIDHNRTRKLSAVRCPGRRSATLPADHCLPTQFREEVQSRS